MRFIIIGDTKGKENGINKKILMKLMDEAERLNPKPEFLIICGDSVAGNSKPEILASQLKDLRLLLSGYLGNIPVMPVIGNHEVNGKPQDDRYEKIVSEAYCDLELDDYLENYNRTVYYKDFKDTRLIVLNTFHFREIQKLGYEQLRWFRSAVSDSVSHKLVFLHSPAFPTGAHLGNCLDLYPENRDIFWKIVQEHKVDLVFSAHEHNYSRRIISTGLKDTHPLYYKRGIPQVITGGGGETLKDIYKSREGIIIPPIKAHHFVVVDIINDYIKATAIDLAGRILDEFIIDKSTYNGSRYMGYGLHN